MTIGLCPDALNHEQKSLLLSAADELIEMVLDDMKSVRLGKRFTDTDMNEAVKPTHNNRIGGS